MVAAYPTEGSGKEITVSDRRALLCRLGDGQLTRCYFVQVVSYIRVKCSFVTIKPSVRVVRLRGPAASTEEAETFDDDQSSSVTKESPFFLSGRLVLLHLEADPVCVRDSSDLICHFVKGECPAEHGRLTEILAPLFEHAPREFRRVLRGALCFQSVLLQME